MWNHWQIPQLYVKTEPTSYWNKFGIPAKQARYFAIESIPNEHSQPWPLWTWWDKSLDARPAPVPAAK
jgi:hypothetical protein